MSDARGTSGDSREHDSRTYPQFEGRVARSFAESRPWWPEPRVAPAGAPNVVVVLCDDLGYSDVGCFGSEIETPNLDRLAADGVRYANFHSTPLCAPTRAALLTGVNHHAAGVGEIILEDHGFPGYRGQLADSVQTAAEIFRANGYGTFAVGKWHLTPRGGMTDGHDRRSWPLSRGFDRYYGFLDGYTNFHQPHSLIQDSSQVETEEYPEGYFLTDDLADRAIAMIRSAKAIDGEKPFFLYLANGAPHAPLMAPAADIAKYRGRYDVGWDRVRGERFVRQVERGLFPEGTSMAPRNAEKGYDVQTWDSHSESEREVLARHMEVYAGMVDNVDQNVGRLLDALTELGELQNTIVVFTSDNGASREGGPLGTSEYSRTLWNIFSRLGDDGSNFERDRDRVDLLGGPRYLSHYPWGWANASNTPFRLYKGTTFSGGHRVPFIVSWPAGIPGRGEVRQQYAHVTDVLPTLVDLIGLEVPAERQGVAVEAMTGASLAPTLDDPDAPATHPEQYYEMRGHRGYYRDGWEIVALHHPGTPFDDDEWQLYHVAEDPAETVELTDGHPERVAELAQAWDEAAWRNRVFPIDDGTTGLFAMISPGAHEPRAVTLTPANHTLPAARAKDLVQERSYTVTVELDFSPGDRGILVAHGDQGGGYALYVEDDELVYAVNAWGTLSRLSGGPLAAGASRIVLDVEALSGGASSASLLVDGVGRVKGEAVPTWSFNTPYEGIDVGIDRRSPVCWDLYEEHGSFAYTGTLRAVTYEPGELAADARQRTAAALREAALRFD